MTIKYKTKMQLQAALRNAGNDKKEIYRILKVCESLGLKWGSRAVYGGGTEISIDDKLDEVAILYLHDGRHHLEFNEKYFDPAFKPTTWEDLRRREIEAEEAIYL